MGTIIFEIYEEMSTLTEEARDVKKNELPSLDFLRRLRFIIFSKMS